eukprot:338462_1
MQSKVEAKSIDEKTNGDDDEKSRERIIRFEKYNLIKSKKPDCILGYDDDDFFDRAEIGCKARHSMTAMTMYSYIWQVLETNYKTTIIRCPICKEVLDWKTCLNIADMNAKEHARIINCIERRSDTYANFKPCPTCKISTVMKSDCTVFRMKCKSCCDWCWNCCQKWKGSGNIYCGNKNCWLIRDLNKILREAPLFTPAYLPENSKIRIPKTRACPMCLTLMEHIKYEKFIRCDGCGKSGCNFCFVCLGIKE